MAACPDVLARDHQTPENDMAALQWQSAESSLLFGAFVESLDFGRRGLRALGYCSGGLLLLG